MSSYVLEHDIFGEVSSSEDEEDKDVNIMDSGDEDQPSIKAESQDASLMEGEESVMSVKDESESYLGAELSAEASELVFNTSINIRAIYFIYISPGVPTVTSNRNADS